MIRETVAAMLVEVVGSSEGKEVKDLGREGRPQGGFGGRSRGGRGGGRRGGGSRGDHGSVVSAGKVLLGLTPSSELIVYEPNGDEVKELAKYKVSEKKTYAYPIPIGNRIYVKDDDSLTLWTLK